MPLFTRYYTLTHRDLYTQTQRNLDESKSTYLLYNGALDTDEDPADYYTPSKAVYVA